MYILKLRSSEDKGSNLRRSKLKRAGFSRGGKWKMVLEVEPEQKMDTDNSPPQTKKKKKNPEEGKKKLQNLFLIFFNFLFTLINLES